MSLDAPSVALVGAGAMGGALVRGWIEAVRKGGALTLSIVDPNFDPLWSASWILLAR